MAIFFLRGRRKTASEKRVVARTCHDYAVCFSGRMTLSNLLFFACDFFAVRSTIKYTLARSTTLALSFVFFFFFFSSALCARVCGLVALTLLVGQQYPIIRFRPTVSVGQSCLDLLPRHLILMLQLV